MSEWRWVPGYEGMYKVSDRGELLSFFRGWGGRPAASYLNGDGYRVYSLTRLDGWPRRHFLAHALVALAFIGPRPDGMVIRHLDGDPSNNTPGNLAYGTNAENVADTVRMGRTRKGSANPAARLSEEQVHEIRRAYRPCVVTMADLAERFGVTRLAVRKVLYGLSWGWLVTPGWAPLEGDQRAERHRVTGRET